MRRIPVSAALLSLFSLCSQTVPAAERISRAIDTRQRSVLANGVHGLAQRRFDLGPLDPNKVLDHVQILIQPSAAQQADLDQLLDSQRNPSSPDYRRWLTPEQFADRFGLSASDYSRIVAWLASQGLSVQDSSRGRNWIAFSGSVARISTAFAVSMRRYRVKGEDHFANATPPSIPAALNGIISGFIGLNDFYPKPTAHGIPIDGDPALTSGPNHYIVPEDFATIYNLNPLYSTGINGSGQSIAVVGGSDIAVSDIRAFRSRFGLPANDPKLLPYGADPGLNGNQFEANLDVEWAGAIAPRATIYYVFGSNPFTAVSAAVSMNVAPIISSSFGYCEIDDPLLAFRTVAQQANVQGITWVNSSGDTGGGSCDVQGLGPLATRGLSVQFPSNIPEVTGVGGTMLDDSAGTYWSARNSVNGGSALSYIPEKVWNESANGFGLAASGGGSSRFFAKPDWQNGPGVPNDGARDVPDVSLTAALHDGYLITYQGSSLFIVGGTSAAAPSFAGILALLNQYQVSQGFQKMPGLGNINPQLYRLARNIPAAFHDITLGDNMVPCEQGSPDCLDGSLGYAANAGYDRATGLGSVDANVLVTSWNQSTNAATLTLSASATQATINDSITLTSTVSGSGGVPTGAVNFFATGIPLGSATLTSVGGIQTASATFTAWVLGTGKKTVYAEYAGDLSFSPASGNAPIQVNLPAVPGVSAVTPSVTNPVYGSPSYTQASTWQANITLQERAGVPALLTAFTIDGQPQPISQYFPSPNIPAGGTLTGSAVLRNLAVPTTKTLGFSGTDPSGQTWARQVSVQFFPPHQESVRNFNIWAAPLGMHQDKSAASDCQWSQRITIDETQGYNMRMVQLVQGEVDRSTRIASIFGTTRLSAWGSISGTVCWSNVTPPATDQLFVSFVDDTGNQIANEIAVTFAGPAAAPARLSAAPAALAMKPTTLPTFQPPVTFSVNLSDETQSWTASVFPANRTTSWLQLSQYTGTGNATITLQANPAGFEPGAYRATILIQSPDTVPEWVAIPVMWVNGAPGGPTIASLSNALSFTPGASPGELVAIYGSQLASTTASAPSLPLSFSMAGVSATVNGWPAPLLYVSSTQINLQVPYEAGAGPAVLGVNNNGQIGGFQFSITPSAPGILTDASGVILGTPSVKAGKYATLYVTGTGDVSPTLGSGLPVSGGTTIANLPKPLLPLTVTIGGIPALIQFAGTPPGVVGLTQVNFWVPPTMDAGNTQIVVTSNGVSSAPATLNVTAVIP